MSHIEWCPDCGGAVRGGDGDELHCLDCSWTGTDASMLSGAGVADIGYADGKITITMPIVDWLLAGYGDDD